MGQLWIQIAKSLPMVTWAIITGGLLFGGNAQDALDFLGKDCPQKVTYSWRSGLAPLDLFLCQLVSFFVQATSSDYGIRVTGYTATLLISVLAFMAVEGSRVKAGWFLSLTWLHATIAQAAGVSVSVPLLWIPAYFLYGAGSRDSKQVGKKKVSLIRVGAIAFFFLFLWLNTIALLVPLDLDQKQLAALIFQAMPGVVCLAYLPFPTSADIPQQRGHKGVIAFHLLQAGLGLTWHLVAFLFLLRDPEILGHTFRLLSSFKTEEYAIYFLLIDVISLFLSFVYLVAFEDGLLVALLEIVGAVLFGPAFAVSAYCVYREQSISKAAAGVSRKKE